MSNDNTIVIDVREALALKEFMDNYNPDDRKNLLFPSMFNLQALHHDIMEYGYDIVIVKRSERANGIDYDMGLVMYKELFMRQSNGSIQAGQEVVDELYDELVELQEIRDNINAQE